MPRDARPVRSAGPKWRVFIYPQGVWLSIPRGPGARNAYSLGVDKDPRNPHFEMGNWWTAVDKGVFFFTFVIHRIIGGGVSFSNRNDPCGPSKTRRAQRAKFF